MGGLVPSSEEPLARPVAPFIKLLEIGVLDWEFEILECGQRVSLKEGRYFLFPYAETEIRLIFRNIGTAPIFVSKAIVHFPQSQEPSVAASLALLVLPLATEERSLHVAIASLRDGRNDVEIFLQHSHAARPEELARESQESRCTTIFHINTEPCLLFNGSQGDEGTGKIYTVDKYRPCDNNAQELVSYNLINIGRTSLSIEECKSADDWLMPAFPKRRIGGGKSRLLRFSIQPHLLQWGRNETEVCLKTNCALQPVRHIRITVDATAFGPILDIDKEISAGRVLVGERLGFRIAARNLGTGRLNMLFTSESGVHVTPSSLSIPGRKPDDIRPPEKTLGGNIETYTQACEENAALHNSANTAGWHLDLQTRISAKSNSYISEYENVKATIKYRLYHGYPVPAVLHFPFERRPARLTVPIEIKATDGGKMEKGFVAMVVGPKRWWRIPARVKAIAGNTFEVTLSLGRFRPWRSTAYSVTFYRPDNKAASFSVPLSWPLELPRRRLRESPTMWVSLGMVLVLLLWIMSR